MLGIIIFIAIMAFVTLYCYQIIYLDQILMPIGIFFCSIVVFGGFQFSFGLTLGISIVATIVAAYFYFRYTFQLKETVTMEVFMALQVTLLIFSYAGLSFVYYLAAQNIDIFSYQVFPALQQLSFGNNLLNIVGYKGLGFTALVFGVNLYLKYYWKDRLEQRLAGIDPDAEAKAKKAQAQAKTTNPQPQMPEDTKIPDKLRPAPMSYKKKGKKRKDN